MPEDQGMIEMTGAEALHFAQNLALEKDESVYLLGEGVADPKGVFSTTTGFAERYGKDRIIETPISENAFTGVAIGSAMLGHRPIVIHQRVEFALLAIEQIFNNAAKAHYVTNGVHRVPLVIRLIVGRGWGQGPLHSQSLESTFAYIPGLKVVLPSTPNECKNLLLASIKDDNPVIFIEHRWVHYGRGLVDTSYEVPSLSGPKRIREGDAITVVASSYMLLETLVVVDALEREGHKVELFDLQVVRPLQLEEIYCSVSRTGLLLVIDTGSKSFGPGAEISAQVTEHCFANLRKAPRRIGLPDHPTPSSLTLASEYYPSLGIITKEICDLIEAESTVATRVKDQLEEQRSTHSFDVPHPTFQGPF